jgi:addiction module HigA family antidote
MSEVVSKPIHPGEVLLNDFLKERDIDQGELARRINCDPKRLNNLLNKKTGITPDMDLRLSKAFNISPGFWLNLNSIYVINEWKEKIKDEIDDIKPFRISSKRSR